VVNRAVVTGLDGKTATATDAGSIATYFIQTTSITNSLLHEQTSIDDAADYLLNPEPEPRYTSVATKFLMLTTAQKDTLATVDIGDTISVEKTFPAVPAQPSWRKSCQLRALSITWTSAQATGCCTRLPRPRSCMS
jgi:hypothetical protein